ncbi:MAG TPA: DinB family protein [Candidatus Binatia bacterium]|nr:DinB family protein [Candidatus Binatia bacterium]
MPNVTAWFERKFEFPFPVELFPNVISRLRGTPARMEEALRGVPSERRMRKPDGKWSAQEHAGHLLDLEPLWLARLEDYVTGREQLTVADLANRKTEDANHNGSDLDEILANFRASRQNLIGRAIQVPPERFSWTLPHPRLKTPMRLIDHLYFVAEHDDHHLAKMWELLEQTG